MGVPSKWIKLQLAFFRSSPLKSVKWFTTRAAPSGWNSTRKKLPESLFGRNSEFLMFTLMKRRFTDQMKNIIPLLTIIAKGKYWLNLYVHYCRMSLVMT